MSLIWFCYALLFTIAAFGVALLYLLHHNAKTQDNVNRAQLRIEELEKAVQYLWEHGKRNEEDI